MKYAIVESGGKQFKAVEGGIIEVDRLPVASGAKLKLEQVLLLADGEKITIGTPLVKNNPVWTTVVEHFKGPKVSIFNYSPKKRIRVKIGHRQNYTRLFVEQIGGTEIIKKEPIKVEKAVEVKAEKLSTKPEKDAKPVKAESKVKTVSREKKPSQRGKKPVTKGPVKPAVKPTSRKPSAVKSGTRKSPKGTTTAKTGKGPKKPAAK